MTRTSSLARMGRPPAYTTEQDSIILANRSYDDVMRRFKECGYEGDWQPKTIASRRLYLKRQGGVPAGTGRNEETLIVLLARRRELEAQRKKHEEQLARINEELQTLVANIHKMADLVKEEVDSS